MEKESRPLISFIVLAYNQECFITDAVKGAFSQTYSPLEIILSDDCSSDRTFEIMKELAAEYQGPHSIILNRNEHNLGLVGHINRVMEITKGELIVGAAGDDISKPQRTERIYQKYIESGKKAFSIFSTQWDTIDAQGNFLGKETFSLLGNHELDYVYFGYFQKTKVFVPGHSHAWHRSVFDVFGPIDTQVISEDVVIPFRSALLGQVQSIHESLVTRRYHSENLGRPEMAVNIRGKADWFKKHRIRRINNLIGIARTFLKDIQTAIEKQLGELTQLDELIALNKKYLAIHQLELEYLKANFLTRLRIIAEGLFKYRMPVTRLIFWVFGTLSFILLSSFPLGILYQFYKKNLKIGMFYKQRRPRR